MNKGKKLIEILNKIENLLIKEMNKQTDIEKVKPLISKIIKLVEIKVEVNILLNELIKINEDFYKTDSDKFQKMLMDNKKEIEYKIVEIYIEINKQKKQFILNRKGV